MRIIQKLPAAARYDYQSIYGAKHYHTIRRRYAVYHGKVYSYDENEEQPI